MYYAPFMEYMVGGGCKIVGTNFISYQTTFFIIKSASQKIYPNTKTFSKK